MKMGKWKTGLSLTLCVLMLVTCFFPASVTALEGAASNQQETQQSQQAESQKDQKEQTDQSEAAQSQKTDSGNEKSSGSAKAQQQEKGQLAQTKSKAALESIIAKDKEGNSLCYTTLYDSKDRIVDTNDPKKKQDKYYQPASEGGKGGTVDLGSSLRVYFRMAEIQEHDGEKGVQENTVYYMQLPQQLVPMEKDKKGNKLVDPDEPLTFFKDGEIECAGGIYSGDEESYELQMQFENVEDQLDVSGAFQYGVTVSKELKQGENCTVDYVPGGSLQFTVTPAKEEPVKASERLSLSASDNSDSRDKIDWTLTLTDDDLKMDAKRLKVKLDAGSAILADKGANEVEDVIKMSSVKITYKNGKTETLKPHRLNSNACSYDRHEGYDTFNPTITYDKEKDMGIFCTAYLDESDYKNENTIVEYSGQCSLVNTLYIDMGGLVSNGSRAGNTNGSSSPDVLDAGIEKYEFTFTSQIYDNYNLAGKGYTAEAFLMGPEENGEVLTTAYTGIGKSFGRPQSGYLKDSTQELSKTYEGMPSYIQTSFSAGNQNYYGNYYWMEFTPQHSYYPGSNYYNYSNDTGANYYTNNYSFFERGGSLTGNYSTFDEFKIGTAGKWSFCGPISYSNLQDGVNKTLGRYLDQSDLVLQHQLKKVFEGMDRSKNLLLYKSTDKVDGRYVYIVIDPDTRETARKNYSSNGWSQLVEMKNNSGSYGTESAQPAKWKIHVFNAPGQGTSLTFKQSHGSFNTGDENTGGGTTDSMLSSNTVYGTAPSYDQAAVSYSGYGFGRNQAAVMTGRWVDQNTIFWEFTCNTENWDSWRYSDVYIKVPQGQTLLLKETSFSSDPHRDIDGQSLLSNGIFYQTSSGTWRQFGGGNATKNGVVTGTTIKDNSPGTTLQGDTVYFAGSVAPTSATSSSTSATYGSLEKYDSRHTKIGFFTRVDRGSIDKASSCEAELVAGTGDMTQWGSGSGATMYPFKVKAKGTMPWMPVSKSLSDTDLKSDGDTDASSIQDTWSLTANSYGTNQTYSNGRLIDGVYTGFYSGTWAAHDDMADSSASGKDGSRTSVNPASYTKLQSMKISSNGPETYGTLFDVTASDLKKAEEAENHTTTLTKDNLTLTLKYQGNMKDGFDIRIDGLKNVTWVKVIYKTSFDQKGFCEAAERTGDTANSVYSLQMKNGASSESWDGSTQPPQSVTVKRNIVASLAMNKAVTKTPEADEEHGGYEAGYKLDTQVGYTATDYVSIEDFLNGYTDSGEGSGKEVTYKETDKRALQALDQAIDVKNMKITVSGPGFDKKQEIYSGGVRDGQWSGRAESGWVVDFVYKPKEDYTEHPGSLYQVKISRADGTKVPADTEISITYDMNTVMDGKDGFRSSEWYHGGNLTISNGGEAAIPYGGSDELQVQTQSRAKMKAKAQSKAAKETVLKVDCGAGVKAEFLADELVEKIRSSSSSESSKASWTIYDWTGTKGKSDITTSLQDAGYYDITEFTYKDPETGNLVKLSEMTDTTKKEELVSHLRYTLEKHTKFENIKVYYTDTKPSGKNAQLSAKDLLHESSLFFKGTDPQQEEKATVKDSAGKEHTVTITTRAAQSDGTSCGFEITADRLEQNHYLAATYDTDTDWESFFEEINGEYTDCTISTAFKNIVFNRKQAEKEESGNHIEILEDGLQKSLTSSSPADGKASWRLKANTGFSQNKTIKLKDSVSVSTEDARIKKAAEAALTIDLASIVVKQNGKVIYKDQKRQADGWTDENLIIHTDGRTLEVTLKNTDDSKVLDAGQDYTVDYDTVLDQDAYIVNGGKAGDSANLQNSALMERGGSTFQASAGSVFTPEIPVTAEKKYKGNGADGKDTSTTLWSVTGKTGNAGRKNFTLQDEVKSDPANEAVQKSLVMSDFDIAVKTGTDDAVHYTVDRLPDDAKFTSEGDSFKLTFAELPKDTEVTVTYSVRIDREKYLAAGGEEGKVLSLKNAFHVAAADGAVADDSKSGTIEVDKPLKKSGKVITKKAENGNPIVTWDFDVNLHSMYTEKELQELKDATVSDVLSPVLLVDLSSIKLTDSDGKEIPGDAYKVSQKRSTLAVQILEPAKYPIFHLQFETECGASVEGLVNNADLRVDGTKVTSSSTEDLGEISAVTQHGHIKSMKVPEYTPVAWKYLDHELCTKAGLFEFSIKQVDENGKAVEGGYTDTATNDANGKITFKTITYRNKPVEGSYYYQVRETSLVKPYTYTLDHRVFTIRVDIQADGSQYLVSSVITDPKQYDEVRFDNATVTTRDFTVTKKWSDSNDRYGLRPKAVQVYLLNHGERYENMSVTLSEENNWTYTWKDLPMAGADYSVEEVPVLGYRADVKNGDWNSTITNKDETGSLFIAKQVKGMDDSKKKYHFTLTLRTAANEDSEQTSLNGTFGDVTFKNGVAEFDLKAGGYVRINGLPAGVFYTVQEADYTKEGFNSPEYINQSGMIQKDDSVMVTVTNAKAGATKTGDNEKPELWAILGLLALMGASAPVMDLHRRRKS